MPEKLKEIIAYQLGVDANEITMETSFKDDLGADSLDLLEVVMAVEDEFDIELPAEELSGIATVEDVIDYLKDKGIEF